MKIEAIPIFNDNYVWLIHDDHHAIVVDPGDGGPVIQRLERGALQLKEIWVTHHHPDHVAGIGTLLRAYPDAIVRAPESSPLPVVSHHHSDTDHFLIFEQVPVTVWFIPGHTPDHIGFLVNDDTHSPALFCGDTLFGAGCGRLFGGTAEQLHASLQRIADLPDATHIYCAHEYTESNLRFALQVDPDNAALQARSSKVHQQRVKGEPTVPLLLEEERLTNPFLRTGTATVSQTVLKKFLKDVAYPDEIFKDLRAWKDAF